MRRKLRCTLLFAFVCLIIGATRANARIIIDDALWYDDSTGGVYGYTSTLLTYPESYWYDAGAESVLVDEFGDVLGDSFWLGGPFQIANTQTFGFPGVSYAQYGMHYLGFYYYVCDYYCYYYDYYGYSFYGGDYPEYYEFEPYYPCYVFYSLYDFADTFLSLTVPRPQCPSSISIQLTSDRTSGSLNGTTQTALLGANVHLTAEVTGTSSVGTYRWTVTGTANQTVNGNTDTVYWRDVGLKTLRVDFTPDNSNCQVSATVNINVVTPTLTNFTGTVPAPPDVGYCMLAPSVPGAVPWLMLGCQRSGFRVSGIRFSATVASPQYISDNGNVKYVQIGSGGITRTNNDGTMSCFTTNGQWVTDADPYTASPAELGPQDETIALRPTASGAETTIQSADTPGVGLDGSAEFVDDEQFEMYVVYFSNGVQMPLAYIAWNWEGDAVRDPSDVVNGYRLATRIPDTADTPRNYTGTPISVIRPYNPNLIFNNLVWMSCGGDLGCDPDGTLEEACRRRGWRFQWDPDTCDCVYIYGQ